MSDPRKGFPSASAMDRLAHCPGSHQAEKSFSQDDSTKVTEDGDDVHAAMKEGDLDELGEDTKVIAERLKSMEERAKSQFLEDVGRKSFDEEIREERFWIGRGASQASAQLDLACISGKNALVIDYKTGYMEVTESHRNYQIRTQVVALWKNRKHLTRIRGAVAAFRFREKYTATDYKPADLLKAEREISFFLWRASSKDAERIPGAWCTYCKAKADCPALASQALLPVPRMPLNPVTQEAGVLESVSGLSLDQLAYLQGKRALADKLFTAVTQRLRNFSKEELQTVGLKLHEIDRFKPSSITPLLQSLMKEGLLKKEECAGCCDVVLKRLSALAIPRLLEKGVSTKKEAAFRIKKLLEPHMVKVPSAPRVEKLNKQEREALNEQNEGK